MARNEKEDVSGIELPEPLQSNIKFYDQNGKQCKESTGVAKIVSTFLTYENLSVQRFVLYGRGEILDPHGVDSRANKSMYKYKKVSEKAFDNYIKYLESKNTMYFTRARRLIME